MFSDAETDAGFIPKQFVGKFFRTCVINKLTATRLSIAFSTSLFFSQSEFSTASRDRIDPLA